MKALCNLFVLMLASFALASCGGGGNGSNSAFGGPANSTTLTLSATTTTLPVNPYTVAEEQSGTCPGNFLGSPYISEVTATWRQTNGQLVSGTSTVNVSVAPTTIIQFSTLNSSSSGGSGSSACSDQFHTLLGSGPVNVTAGVGTIYVHSGQTPGQGTLTVSAVDPVSHQTISAQLTITVAGGATGLPTSITVSSSGGAYVASSGGISSLVSATVTDGSGALVADPNTYDNVQFSIAGPSNSDARLSAVTAAGQTVTGASVATVTHNGVANATLLPGSQQGPVQVKATADRSDGNVDNGVQDAVSATTTVVVSDGKLYSLTLTSPGSNAPSILINRVSTQATLSTQQTGGTVTIPPDPNATYSFTVSAIGTDREGNPVLPGTQIKFGSIDSPVDAKGNYQISGAKGDPQEGGTLFSATDGQFTTAGGGAGPGDTLLVFGKLVAGNSDLESAATVQSVQNAQNLTVTAPFNLNDTTGSSVNYGPVLPYIVGRAQIGNITSPATTNNVGVASTTLNYPVSALGHVAGVWAQSAGTDNITGGTKIVTDINLFAFPGIAPASIIISPNPIPGNLTLPVYACIYDALGSPLQGVQFQFSFTNMGVGSGTLDGINGAGSVPDLTDASGCVATTVSTTGIVGSGGGSIGAPGLTFTAGNATSTAPITASGNLILLAKPTSFIGTDGGTVTLTLLNGNGTPVPGAQLTGTCTNAGIVSGPGVTNSAGQTTVVITANLNIPNAPGSASCTFTTSTGSPSVTVTLQGVDPCKSAASPLPAACTSSGGSNVNLALQLNSKNVAPPNAYGSATGNPALTGTCAMTSNTSVGCSGSYAIGTNVTLTATQTGGIGGVTWGGACASAGSNLTATITMTANQSCTLLFKP